MNRSIWEQVIRSGGMETSIWVMGYDVLGEVEQEGLRYAWKKDGCKHYIESAAFINRRKMTDEGISAYTTSVSAGCILRLHNNQCTFCRTGNTLPFGGLLSYIDIAKQNVFMVLTDLNCENHPELALREREFAYMGQGEPGFSYQQVRLAIELTNRIMDGLGQKVYRHVFATCGVPDAIYAYQEDVKSFFTKRVTLHFSLHATKQRSLLMPINLSYPYQKCIAAVEKAYDVSGEKPCIGIMLFNNFKPRDRDFIYTNTYQNVEQILLELNPQKCRLSFCEYNGAEDICEWEPDCRDMTEELVKLAEGMGFETKLFSSFGRGKQSACGMLGGKTPECVVSEKWKYLEREANRLIEQYK